MLPLTCESWDCAKPHMVIARIAIAATTSQNLSSFCVSLLLSGFLAGIYGLASLQPTAYRGIAGLGVYFFLAKKELRGLPGCRDRESGDYHFERSSPDEQSAISGVTNMKMR